MKLPRLLACLIGLPIAALAQPSSPEVVAAAHLARLSAAPWGAPWKDATVASARVVEPEKQALPAADLPPVGFATVRSADGASGYLMWEGEELVEFAAGETVIRAHAIPGFWVRREWLHADSLPEVTPCLEQVLAAGD